MSRSNQNNGPGSSSSSSHQNNRFVSPFIVNKLDLFGCRDKKRSEWCLWPIYVAPNGHLKCGRLICFIELAQRLNWTRPHFNFNLSLSIFFTRSRHHIVCQRDFSLHIAPHISNPANCTDRSVLFNWENRCGAQLNSIKLNWFIVSKRLWATNTHIIQSQIALLLTRLDAIFIKFSTF